MRHLLTPLAAALLLSTPWIACAADPATPPRYTIKQDRPDTGSHILRDVVTGSHVPFDKPYGELSPQQQAIVKSQYEAMGTNDEPPYPLKGPQSLYKAMAAGQDHLRARGHLSLLVDVDSRGEAQSVSVLVSPDPLLTKYAAGVLMNAKYKPARCDGAPCAMQYPFRINFTMRD
ncbi:MULTISPECIES: energy transducer TonB [unclassified Rhizobacter]|uniref:energy transducer TonB n=1 Tax=unclassified Rhizobacter TaxID=2640088 RepID=UPI0006F33626|nr:MULTISPECIES: energy transducer TonB [unclassified Rhizobacter]KQU76017.1 hypothetical protein ASC88_24275 [Rhizobacter sp. Root29]KQW08728.1 hypothetical protein ASC98_24705 [Rhizobacter sp. Root1238]KRB16298.1 hypothetical protein ASE08_25585 [Rhizobacter sp. Root16D2]